jgi:hypothetical protein
MLGFLLSIPPVRPVISFLDGHSSHYCPETIRMHKVVLCALPPNTTHLLQPLDKGCFSPLKVNWQEICHQFCASNPGRTDMIFVNYSLKLGTRLLARKISFKATGICPFNHGAVYLSGEDDEFSFKPSNLAERTGLAYIPLYSPARHRVIRFSDDHIGQSISRTQSHLSFSEPNLLDQSLFEI